MRIDEIKKLNEESTFQSELKFNMLNLKGFLDSNTKDFKNRYPDDIRSSDIIQLWRRVGDWVNQYYLSGRKMGREGQSSFLNTLVNKISDPTIKKKIKSEYQFGVMGGEGRTKKKIFMSLLEFYTHVLPRVIDKVHGISKSERKEIKDLAYDLSDSQDNFDEIVEDVKTEVARINHGEKDQTQKGPGKKDKDRTGGEQRSQAEKLVSDILNKIRDQEGKNVAHEIRSSVQRADNKLQALQKEIMKRNITIEESLKLRLNKLFERRRSKKGKRT